MAIHRFESPTRFIAGTVGMPGERTFYLQATDGKKTISVALEKEQVAALADRIESLLGEVAARNDDIEIPAYVPAEADDREPLATPIDEEFRVGVIGIGWDTAVNKVVIEAQSQDEDSSDVLIVFIAAGYARAFIARSRLLVAAGRPGCPFCGLPLDPTGHICPRSNGYRADGTRR